MNKNFYDLYINNDLYKDQNNVKQPIISTKELTEGFEKSKLYKIDDIKNNYKNYDYKDLKNYDLEGSLLASYYDNDELKQVFLPKTHKIILGTTGSGKTQSYILPYIKAVSSFKNPYSLVLSDLKGELYSLTANDLKNKGYNVLCFNLKNALYSEMWNPLAKVYDLMINRKKDAKIISKNTKFYFDNIEYDNYENANRAKEEMLEQLNMEGSKLISTICYSMIKTESNDPYWDNSAREFIEAIIYRFLEFAAIDVIDKKQFNFKNIIDIIATYSERNLNIFFDEKYADNSLSYRLASKTLSVADTTKQCILSTASTKLTQYKSYNIQRATIDNTIDFSKFDDEPTALFMIIDDVDKGSYELIKLMISLLYNELDSIANSNKSKKLSRPFEFILDEFCNIPPIENFGNMISTSRSKDIWFTMAIQSYAQLETKYGKEVKEIILNNSNMEVFFGTNDYDTKKLFSKKCGTDTRISNSSYYNGNSEKIDNYQKEEYQIVTISDLSMIQEDNCFIRYLNYPVFKTILTRFYKTKEFISPIMEFNKIYNILLSDSKYKFDFIKYKEELNERKNKNLLEKFEANKYSESNKNIDWEKLFDEEF